MPPTEQVRICFIIAKYGRSDKVTLWCIVSSDKDFLLNIYNSLWFFSTQFFVVLAAHTWSKKPRTWQMDKNCYWIYHKVWAYCVIHFCVTLLECLAEGPNPLKGDLLVIGGSMLYAISNVTEVRSNCTYLCSMNTTILLYHIYHLDDTC